MRTVAVPLAAVLAGALPALPATEHHDREIQVTARTETPALFDDDAGGNADADDSAIWVDRAHPGRTLVIGTAKNAGLRVYDLAGHEVQAIPAPPPPAPGSSASTGSRPEHQAARSST